MSNVIFELQVYISTRTGTWVIQRAADQGRPFDHVAITRFRQGIPWPYLRPFMYHGVNNRYSHSKYSLSPNTRFNGGAVTISDDLPNRILLGRINMITDVERFTENGAVFVDGTELDNIDVVILGTGFKYSFPFIQKDAIKVENAFPFLYDLVWPADMEPATLAIIGLVQPLVASLQFLRCSRDVQLVCSLETASCQVLHKDYKWWKRLMQI